MSIPFTTRPLTPESVFPYPFPLKPKEVDVPYNLIIRAIHPDRCLRDPSITDTEIVPLESMEPHDKQSLIDTGRLYRYYNAQSDGMCAIVLVAQNYRQYLDDTTNLNALYQATKWFIELMSYETLPSRAQGYLATRLSTWNSNAIQADWDSFNHHLNPRSRPSNADLEREKKLVHSTILDKIFNQEDQKFLEELADNNRVFQKLQRIMDLWHAQGIGLSFEA